MIPRRHGPDLARRGCILAAACLLLGGAARGQSDETLLPESRARAQAIVEGGYAAMGEAAARQKIRSVTARARAKGPSGPYQLTMRAAAGRVEMEQHPEQGDPFVGVVSGPDAWSGTGGEAHRLDREVAAIVRAHAFQWTALHVEEAFSGLELDGEAFFGGGRCHRLRGVDELEMPCAVYFDADTGLLAGYEIADPIEEGTVVVRFASWRAVDGVQLPAEVVATDADGDFILDFHAITVNDVDDARFQVPAQLRR
jgi:hypothetical protein